MSNVNRRVTVIQDGEDRTEKGVREGVNVRRGADNDERGYRLILIMESVQVKRSIFPPAHVHPFSNPIPFSLPLPCYVPDHLVVPFYPCLDL